MVKIAAEVDRALARRALHGTPGAATGRRLARGDGWAVDDVVCTSGPTDRSFEERHDEIAVAIVAAGTFQYRSTTGRALMTPGSLLLGNVGDGFECAHEHGAGDRCIAFRFTPEYFERIAIDVRASGTALNFREPRLPPMRASSTTIAQACAALSGTSELEWEEIGVRLAGTVARQAGGAPHAQVEVSPRSAARVTHILRTIEREPGVPLTLRRLAASAELSPYHFLRTFEQVTGVTPHQYVRRTRLREAAMRLALESERIIEIAFESGFGDLSNFNRAFRTEFGVSPRVYRREQREGSTVTSR